MIKWCDTRGTDRQTDWMDMHKSAVDHPAPKHHPPGRRAASTFLHARGPRPRTVECLSDLPKVQGCGLLVQTNRGPGYAYSYSLLVFPAAPSYLKLYLLDDVLIPPSREQIKSPARLPHLQPSAPPLSPGPTPVYANRTPKHGASRHTRQSPHPRRELCGRYPNGLLLFAGVPPPNAAAGLLPAALRLPHPVASHAPGLHDVAKCCQCPSNTTTPPPPPGSSPPARTQFDDICRQARAACDNLRKTVTAQPPGTVIMSPSDHRIWGAMSLSRLSPD